MSTHLYRNGGSDPEDLWDFGTVRHAATIGRAAPNPVQVSGPPLTWEMNGTTRTGSDESSHSGGSSYSGRRGPSDSSIATTVNAKGELPPIPGSAAGPPTPSKRSGSYNSDQATIRHGNSANNVGLGARATRGREPSDEDDYEGAYAVRNHLGGDVDDDLPDTTMLDSVVLPAIASVSGLGLAVVLSLG